MLYFKYWKSFSLAEEFPGGTVNAGLLQAYSDKIITLL